MTTPKPQKTASKKQSIEKLASNTKEKKTEPISLAYSCAFRKFLKQATGGETD